MGWRGTDIAGKVGGRMADQPIRIGRVSSVNYDTGMMRVVYNDKGKTVTKELPFLNYNEEYTMPTIGEQVLTAHLSNGNSRGVVVGKMWNKKNRPAESGKGIYRKELSRSRGSAYIRYEDETGIYYLVAGTVKITGINEIELGAPKISVDAGEKLTEKAEERSTSAGTWKVAVPEIMLGEASEDGEPVSDINVASTANVSYAADGKKLDVSAEEIEQKAKAEMHLAAETDLKLEDATWSTSLKKIMERLAALDGDLSDKK